MVRLTLMLATLMVFIGCAGEGDSDNAGREVKAPAPSGDGSPHVLIGYHSLTGNTRKLAAAVAEGVAKVPGVTVVVRKVSEITREDLDLADGLVLGSPTYYGNIPGEMKAVLDHWSWKMKIDFTNKVGGAFATGGEVAGGQEHVVLSLLLFMVHNRMILVGPLHERQTTQFGSSGAVAVTGKSDPGVGGDEVENGRKLGERVASITKRLHGRAK